jgi:hypothetical protein
MLVEMGIAAMYNDYTPNAFARTSPTPTASRGHTMKIIARRARIEHMAVELLQLSGSLRLPVPVDEIYSRPPLQLWAVDPERAPQLAPPTDDPFAQRLTTARAIARLVGESAWSTRVRLMSSKPLTADDIDTFAATLLVPTALLSALNSRQRAPQIVAVLFQVPISTAIKRLTELGYLATDPEPVQPDLSPER